MLEAEMTGRANGSVGAAITRRLYMSGAVQLAVVCDGRIDPVKLAAPLKNKNRTQGSPVFVLVLIFRVIILDINVLL